jgi:hypothetical protein
MGVPEEVISKVYHGERDVRQAFQPDRGVSAVRLESLTYV